VYVKLNASASIEEKKIEKNTTLQYWQHLITYNKHTKEYFYHQSMYSLNIPFTIHHQRNTKMHHYDNT